MDTADYLALKRDNEKRLREAERTGKTTVEAWPAEMVFEFTAACNIHCFMCGYEMLRDDLRGQGRTKFTLPVETFRLIAEKAFPHIRVVNPTTSGEPFVLPYWDELIDKVAHYGCKLELVTNGMLLRGERLHKLMPHLVNLAVSFDGATKATFDYVRTGAKFEQVMENIAAFAKLRKELGLEKQIHFAFNVTLLAENVHELPQIIEIAAAHGVDSVMATYMAVMREDLRKSSPLSCPAKTNQALAAARQRAKELGVDVRLPSPLPLDSKPQVEAPIGAVAPRGEAPPTASQPTAEEPPPPAPQPAATDKPAAVPRNSTIDDSGSWLASGKPANWKGKYYCNMPWRRIYIGMDGETFPCCAPVRPMVGNVFQEDFFAIWNSAEYQRLRDGLYNGELTDYCRRCPFLQQTGDMPYESDVQVYSKG